MNSDLEINHRVTIPGGELEFAASRSSGPGGQSVNKTNSRVTLTWNPSQSSALTIAQKRRVVEKWSGRLDGAGLLRIHAEGERSQYMNKEAARSRLATLLIAALVIPKARRDTKPTRSSKEKRIKGKKKQSEKKQRRQKPTRFD